ncbi:MAG: hypothetical protein EON87_06475 [Brevundimonas sp.]|nr:MAG: hypothetical protein EON87_06475 [Brevundimonas sp.]
MPVNIGADVFIKAALDTGEVVANHPSSPVNEVSRDWAQRKDRYEDNDLIDFASVRPGKLVPFAQSLDADGSLNWYQAVKLRKHKNTRKADCFAYIIKDGHRYRRIRLSPKAA